MNPILKGVRMSVGGRRRRRLPETTTQYATANLNIWQAATGGEHTSELPRGAAVEVTGKVASGRAVDVMIPDHKVNNALGWEIATYYRTNAERFNITYIIFDQKIWSAARDGQGWRSMAGRGGDTANHKDHVHINT
ncbi:MAG: hypothetical protein Q4P15_08920 [Propionibacteriaceae bacterium]|nr:hypothetical protein [Propionibacteriaceae bacterium]